MWFAHCLLMCRVLREPIWSFSVHLHIFVFVIQAALSDLLEDNPESGLHDLWIATDVRRWNGVTVKQGQIVSL